MTLPIQAYRNWRAGHAIGHAVRLALLNNEANNLNRRKKWVK